MGSVKDLSILQPPSSTAEGSGRFTFSDRYSVFDWGEMPDHIPNKGTAIAVLGAYFFEKLELMGIPTHYKGLVENGTAKKLAQLHEPSNVMEIRLLRVLKPEMDGDRYNYQMFRDQPRCVVIPLEIIYRNFLPEGSSMFKRLARGDISIADLGLRETPLPNQKCDPPIYDVSTKLEATDRYMKWEEAKRIAGLTDSEFKRLRSLSEVVNSLVTRECEKIGLVNEDGKIEAGFDCGRHIVLVDVLGTLDECRFTYSGIPVSKEIARIHYRQTPWFTAAEAAKQRDRRNWKENCTLKPEPLPPKLKNAISQLYCACTNEITRRKWFSAPPIDSIISDVKEFVRVEIR